MKSRTSQEVVLDRVEPRPPVGSRGRARWCGQEVLRVARALAELAVMLARVSVSRNFGRCEGRVRGDGGGGQRGQTQRAEGAPTRLAAPAEKRE